MTAVVEMAGCSSVEGLVFCLTLIEEPEELAQAFRSASRKSLTQLTVPG